HHADRPVSEVEDPRGGVRHHQAHGGECVDAPGDDPNDAEGEELTHRRGLAQPWGANSPSGLHVKPEGGLGGCCRWYWLLFVLMSTQQVGAFLSAGLPVASSPLESKLCTLRSAASTAARVGFTPAACRAWVKSRAEDHP